MNADKHPSYMIACPACGAKEGEPCKRSLTLGPHAERIKKFSEGAKRFLADVFGKERRHC